MPDGSAQPGPSLPDSPKIESFSGVNPMTGKSVTIDCVTQGEETLLRVSTFYPDNEYDTNKSYIFTLDSGHNVNRFQCKHEMVEGWRAAGSSPPLFFRFASETQFRREDDHENCLLKYRQE